VIVLPIALASGMLLLGVSIVLAVFGPSMEGVSPRAFWRAQIDIMPAAFLVAVCLIPLSFPLFRDLGIFLVVPLLTYSIALFVASVIAIIATRGRRILIWVSMFGAAVIPFVAFMSSALHGP